MDIKLLKNLYSIHSPSGGEQKLTTFITEWVKYYVPAAAVVVDYAGNVLITKGASADMPCFVAHLDQVQRVYAKDFCVIEFCDRLAGFSPSLNEFQGLGADDKNGIFICLKLLEMLPAVKIALFVEEETGGRGSAAVNMAFFDNVRYVVEIDRRGSSDFIVNASGVQLCDDTFITDALAAGFGYTVANGLFTDVVNLVKRGVNVSCVNVSCGYHTPHTISEITDINELLNCYKFCAYIANNCTKKYTFTPPVVDVFGAWDDFTADDWN